MEQYQKYLSVLKDLDQCEKRVGPWEPKNNFHNIYNMIDSLQEQIESINQSEDAKKSIQTPSNSDQMLIPPTPGGNRKVKLFMEKAKIFNKELQNLATKMNQIQDVAYEEQKVDLVFNMTEKSIE